MVDLKFNYAKWIEIDRNFCHHRNFWPKKISKWSPHKWSSLKLYSEFSYPLNFFWNRRSIPENKLDKRKYILIEGYYWNNFPRRKSMKQNTYFKYLIWYHSSSRKNFIVNWKKSSATFDHHDDVWFWVYSGARGIFFLSDFFGFPGIFYDLCVARL